MYRWVDGVMDGGMDACRGAGVGGAYWRLPPPFLTQPMMPLVCVLFVDPSV